MEKGIKNMFVVTTQALENYGAHEEDGKFSSDNARWKFKSGSTYLVHDLERPQDAMAFVMAAFSENNLGWKEYPSTCEDYDDWIDQIRKDADGDQEQILFYKKYLYEVSPKSGTKITRYPDSQL
jgi:hypothetical protein|tara:strand:+ start:127 stop:498 length:372 start_codon:yes stop_codon:yes gene_type:complete